MSKILIAGDLFPTVTNTEEFKNGDIESIFGKELVLRLKSADCFVCNLEGALCSGDTKPVAKDGPSLRAPAEAVKGIAALGVRCVSLANNHTTDYGTEGYKQTCKVLRENNIAFFGAGDSSSSLITHHIVTIDNKRIAFYGVSETIFNIPGKNSAGANLYDEYRTCEEIREIKKSCDLLVVLYHGGIEHFEYPTDRLRTRFHRMADSGADLVLAQHTHCIGAEEYYNSAYLLYGQGNFCLNFRPKPNKWNLYGLLLELEVNDSGFKVSRTVVKRTDIGTSLDKEQDLSAFSKRSELLKADRSFEKEFAEFADERYFVYLQAFRGKNLRDRLVRKLFGKKRYRRYLLKRYTKPQLLKILNALRSDEFGAITVQGIRNMIDRM